MDGKSKKVLLTDKGKVFAKDTVEKLFEAEVAAFKGWSEEEIDRYMKLMEKYVDSFRVQIESL